MNRKIAMITGSAKGIGLATAKAFIAEGYDLILHYRGGKETVDELCRQAHSLGLLAIGIHADLCNMGQLRQMFDTAFESFPTIDVLVNNAGSSAERYFLDVTEDDFDQMTAVDWKALFFCAQLTAKRMVDQKTRGVIINLTSNQAVGCWPRATIYAPIKAAVSKFTQNAAMELAPHGVRMVAIAPGYTDIGWAEDSAIRDAEQWLPLKRFASTEEIAQGIVYLASPQAAYMTGSVLTIDGGATLPVVACNDFVPYPSKER